MKRFFILLMFAAACASPSTPSPGGSQLTGAAAPRLAVEQFLNAIRAQDLQAMSVLFGTSAGPARDQIERGELEKREIIMQCYFNHDKFRILGESPGPGAARTYRVELTRGRNTRQTSATAVRGPGDRWYVESLDIAAVRDFCFNETR